MKVVREVDITTARSFEEEKADWIEAVEGDPFVFFDDDKTVVSIEVEQVLE